MLIGLLANAQNFLQKSLSGLCFRTQYSQAAVLQNFALRHTTALQAMELALREENNVLKERIRSFSATTPVKSAPTSTSAAVPEGTENGHGDAGMYTLKRPGSLPGSDKYALSTWPAAFITQQS